MNSSILFHNRVLIPTLLAAAAVGAGGIAWADTHDNVHSGERARVAEAAVRAVGAGTVLDVEHSDDLAGAYEVELRQADGSEVDVILDKDLRVLHRENDGDRDDDTFQAAPRDNDDNPDADGPGLADADDRPLTAAERSQIKAAVAKALGSKSVTDMEASDDLGAAYEAEAYDRSGTEWDVELDEKFVVVSKSRDS